MPKCQFEGCKKKAALIVGDCSYCKSKFCALHRLPEGHACINLSDCKKEHFDKNSNTLMDGKVRDNRGLAN